MNAGRLPVAAGREPVSKTVSPGSTPGTGAVSLPRKNARGTCSIEGCDRPHYAKGWCNPHYLRWYRTGVAPTRRPVLPTDPAERFWSQIALDCSTGCWLWTGKVGKHGYAVMSVENKQRLVHRWAYKLLVGPIPDGLELDHVWARGCRHRHCVNPAHLEPVTRAENQRRAEPTRRTHCPAGHPYDEENTYWRQDRPGTRQCRACSNGHRRAS